ncbi:MAG: DUF1214 domain-containing protein [Methanomassiliicoccus sp.]|nr:DUF1214 domain-containing protein [Methanomassiliicoccus sp.]
MDVWEEHQTAVSTPDHVHGLIPINQVLRPYREQQIEQLHTAPYPYVDGGYVGGWFNLTTEPMVLSVPASSGRYYVLMLEDMWTNDLPSIGPRTTGNGSGNFVLVAPGWNGTLPSNMTKIQSTTTTIMLAGRTQQDGPADLTENTAFLDNITIIPLSAWGTHYTPPTTVPVNTNVIPNASASTSAAYVANMTSDEFYGRLTSAMGSYPPPSIDAAVIDQIARIGIIPGKPFDWDGLSATMQEAIVQGTQDGIAQVTAAEAHWPGVVVANGWNITHSMGAFGTDYALRAGLASGNSAGNLQEDALYWWSFANATDVPYSGGNNYVLHFAKESIPPVNAFWSVTLYDSEGHFVTNPLSQYAITSHSGNPKYNPDGSLDIYIQQTSPGAEKESNWLPAPSGGFMFILRMYWPQDSALNGSWVPPAVQTVGPAIMA